MEIIQIEYNSIKINALKPSIFYMASMKKPRI